MAAGAGRGGKEGRMPRLSRKWRILVVRSNISRPSGIRSDQWELRWFRILCLFGTFGVVCRFGARRRVAGGGRNGRDAAKIKPEMADRSRKKKYLPIRWDPRRSVGDAVAP